MRNICIAKCFPLIYDYCFLRHSPLGVSRWEEAKESFERSLRLDGGNAEGWLGLGRVKMTMGDEDAAERHYARCVGVHIVCTFLFFETEGSRSLQS